MALLFRRDDLGDFAIDAARQLTLTVVRPRDTNSHTTRETLAIRAFGDTLCK
jgi:hypothetical protein